MSLRNTSCWIAAIMIGLAGWAPLVGQPGISGLPIVEDFEGPVLDPGIYLDGRSLPTVTGDDVIAGELSLSFPCKDGDDPETIVHPVLLPHLNAQGTIALWKDCYEEGSLFDLVQVDVQDGSRAEPAVIVQLKRQGGLFWISAAIGTDNGTLVSSSWLPLDAEVTFGEPFTFELSWKAAHSAGSQDGGLSLELRHQGGMPMLAIDLSGIDNDSHLIGRVRIGILDAQGLGGAWSAMLLDDLAITP